MKRTKHVFSAVGIAFGFLGVFWVLALATPRTSFGAGNQVSDLTRAAAAAGIAISTNDIVSRNSADGFVVGAQLTKKEFTLSDLIHGANVLFLCLSSDGGSFITASGVTIPKGCYTLRLFVSPTQRDKSELPLFSARVQFIVSKPLLAFTTNSVKITSPPEQIVAEVGARTVNAVPLTFLKKSENSQSITISFDASVQTIDNIFGLPSTDGNVEKVPLGGCAGDCIASACGICMRNTVAKWDRVQEICVCS